MSYTIESINACTRKLIFSFAAIDLSEEMKKIPQQFERKMKYLKNQEKICYRENEDTSVNIHMIAIHGNMTCSLTFERLMNELNKIIHVVAPCLRGMGYSPITYKIKDFEDLANDLLLLYE